MMPSVREAYDRIADTYDAVYTHRLDRNENQIISRMLSPYSTGRVLDLGCGTGIALSLDGISQDRYVGLDISERMLSRAHSKYPGASFQAGDMHSIAAPDNSFDNIISLFGSLSYATRPFTVVGEMYRLLRPGGGFFVMAYGMAHVQKKGYCLYGQPVTRLLYTPESLRHLLRWRFAHVDTLPFSFGALPGIVPPRLYVVLETVLRKLRCDGSTFVIAHGNKSG